MRYDIAAGIKHMMVKRGVRQKEIAEHAGFSQQQFSDMMNGRKVIKAEYIPAIADALGVGVADIYVASANGQ